MRVAAQITPFCATVAHRAPSHPRVQSGGSARVLRTLTAWLSQLQSGRRGRIRQ
jgi:hypothetical protein